MSEWTGRPWETEGDLPWDTPDEGRGAEDDGEWRGEMHLADWPEDLAGPEYWLYKAMDERDAA